MMLGKRSLWENQSRSLEALRSRISVPHVIRMLKLFDEHRKGLEQEALLAFCLE